MDAVEEVTQADQIDEGRKLLITETIEVVPFKAILRSPDSDRPVKALDVVFDVYWTRGGFIEQTEGIRMGSISVPYLLDEHENAVLCSMTDVTQSIAALRSSAVFAVLCNNFSVKEIVVEADVYKLYQSVADSVYKVLQFDNDE